MQVFLPSRRIEADSPAYGVQRALAPSVKATCTVHVSCISYLARVEAVILYPASC